MGIRTQATFATRIPGYRIRRIWQRQCDWDQAHNRKGPVLLGGVINGQTNPMPPIRLELSYTHVFSSTFYSETLINNSWDHTESGGAGNQNVDYASQLGLPNPFGQTSFPGIFGATQPGVGNQQGSDLMNFYYGSFRSNSQIITGIDENLSKIIQRHQLQFGGRYRHERISILPDQAAAEQTTFGGNGTALVNPGTIASSSFTATPFTGLAIADFFLGSAQSYATTLNHGRYNFRDQEIATYFQDDFHVNSKLVLNLGIRWEIHPALHEAHDFITTFDLPNHAIVLGSRSLTMKVLALPQPRCERYGERRYQFETADQVGLPASIIPNNYFTFAPRFGFAYRPLGDKRGTVVRGGYGTYIYPPPLRNFYADNRQNAPFFHTYNQDYTRRLIARTGCRITLPGNPRR